MSIVFNDIEHGWPLLLRHVLEHGRTAIPRGYPTVEVSPVMFTLTDPSQAVLHSDARKLNHAFSAAEFCWVMAGQDEVEPLAFFNSKMRDFADQPKILRSDAFGPGSVVHNARLFGAYGPPIVAQLPYVLENLRDRDSRQAVLTIWRPSPPRTKDVPCTIALQFFLRGGELSMLTTMRSNDLWLGVPYDVPLFCRILYYVASRLGAKVGAYHHVAGSLHIYERDVPLVEHTLSQKYLVGPRPSNLVVGAFADEDPQSVWVWVKDIVRYGYVPGSPRWGTGWNDLAETMGNYVNRKLAKDALSDSRSLDLTTVEGLKGDLCGRPRP